MFEEVLFRSPLREKEMFFGGLVFWQCYGVFGLRGIIESLVRGEVLDGSLVVG